MEWHNKNILKIGNENKLIINILDASITKNEIENVDAKKYEEKTIYKYELFFLVEYELYDDSGFFKSNTTVQTSRSTTSQKYISLNEVEIIINELLITTMKAIIRVTAVYMITFSSKLVKHSIVAKLI